MNSKTRQGFTSELIGTFFLLLAVVGSGIMAQNLSPNDAGLQLLENSFATAGALICLILVFGSTSGAHFNPLVTFWARTEKQIDTRTAGFFVLAQLIGAASGAMAANLIFELDIVNWSTKDRTGWEIWLSEAIATFGLLMVIIGVVRSHKEQWMALAVAAYIAGAYFFTSSTSFANPAVTVARTVSDSFAGISPSSAPMFIVSQLVGCSIALIVMNVSHPRSQ